MDQKVIPDEANKNKQKWNVNKITLIVDKSFPIVVRAIPIGHMDWLIYKGFSLRSRVLFYPQFTKVLPVSYIVLKT
jgi:hypothetical protein